MDGDYFDAVSGSVDKLRLEQMVDSGFVRGRMIAFVDPPVSFHTATPHPFVEAPPRSRKILRTHVMMGEEDRRRVYTDNPFIEACNEYQETARTL